MADDAPLLFQARLGGLFPCNRMAEEAMQHIAGKVRVKITAGIANERRRSLYWAVAALVVPLLNDKHGMTLDEADLHDLTRQKLGVGEWLELPSGDRRFKPASTAARSMSEADRVVYTDRALALWSTWVGVLVETLREESER